MIFDGFFQEYWKTHQAPDPVLWTVKKTIPWKLAEEESEMKRKCDALERELALLKYDNAKLRSNVRRVDNWVSDARSALQYIYDNPFDYLIEYVESEYEQDSETDKVLAHLLKCKLLLSNRSKKVSE